MRAAWAITKDDKYIGCLASALPEDENSFPVITFCANNGGNVAPGVNGIFNGSLSGIATIFPKQVDNNGVTKGINVKASPTDEQLAQVDTVCHEALNPKPGTIAFEAFVGMAGRSTGTCAFRLSALPFIGGARISKKE